MRSTLIVLAVFGVFLASSCAGGGSGLKSKLYQSCMEHSAKYNDKKDSEPLCECMAEELMTNELVTDEARQRLADDWNGGMNIQAGDQLGEKDGELVGIGMMVWGNCMKKLQPEFFNQGK